MNCIFHNSLSHLNTNYLVYINPESQKPYRVFMSSVQNAFTIKVFSNKKATLVRFFITLGHMSWVTVNMHLVMRFINLKQAHGLKNSFNNESISVFH